LESLLLVHNYRASALSNVLGQWWTLILIFGGGVKTVLKGMAARSYGDRGNGEDYGGRRVFLFGGF